MSVNYEARLVVGVRLDVRKVVTSVTKFNEDTGERYEIKGTKEVMYLPGSEIIVEEDFYEYFEEENCDLHMISQNCVCGDDVNDILGITWIRLSDQSEPCELTQKTINQARMVFHELVKKHFNYSVDPQVFMLCHVS